MITSPTSSQLLTAVRNELQAKIKPCVSDPEALGILGMIDSILANVAFRAGHEVAWMREEIAEIERGAETVIAAGGDKGDRVSEALKTLREQRSPSDHLDQLDAEYQLAGEVLSRTIEAAMTAGGELRETITNILAKRTAREVQIRGEFSLAGRD